jgi:hypothetical protein
MNKTMKRTMADATTWKSVCAKRVQTIIKVSQEIKGTRKFQPLIRGGKPATMAMATTKSKMLQPMVSKMRACKVVEARCRSGF